MVTLKKILIDQRIVNIFEEKIISILYLEMLKMKCECKEKSFSPYNLEPDTLSFSFAPILFEDRFKSYKNSVPNNDIVEYAAVGHILSYIVETRQNAEEFEVCSHPDSYDCC